jgi:hypothetical protein
MADNKLLLKRTSDEDFLAEDDPLAELARIVGFDPTPAAKAAAPLQRREPAFDLEDELLKELEIYAQPQPAALDPAPISVAAPAYEPVLEPVVEPESILEAAHAVPEIEPDFVAAPVREPVILEAVETFADASEGRVYERPASHPVFDLEDEILREFAAFDARHVSGSEEQVVEAEVIHQPSPQIDALPAELHDAPDIRSLQAVSVPREHGREIYASFHGDDLDEAISGAISPVEAEVAATPAAEEVLVAEPMQQPVFEPVEDHSALAVEAAGDGHWPASEAAADVNDGDRLQQTEWQPEKAEWRAEDDASPAAYETPAVQLEVVEPEIEDFVDPVADDLVGQDFADVIPMAQPESGPTLEEQAVQAFAAPIEERATAPAASADDYGLDALLAEVERYPVAENTARWGVQSKPIPAEEVAKAAPPVVQDFLPHMPIPPVVAAAAIPVAAAAADHEAEIPFEDGNFELDLGDIELDLSDINDASMDVSPQLLSDMADETVVAAEPAYRPIEARSVDTDYSSLPFDPSQIAQEEEPFEAISEMDVPDVPVVHEEEPPAPHPEYDIDLDAEMAQLFATATAQPVTTPRAGLSGDAPINLSGAQPRSQPAALDLDEFERALEEDFRRSFAENRTGSSPDRVALAPVYAEAPQGRGRRSLVLLASAAVAIVLFGGAGVYAFMSGDTKILTSSEPKVILADTDPVKVVPTDPGGKQVPNQNKAVYDRVAGTKTDEAKQESLVTSNEEPVDVVQRTLMPEALPMDDDAMAAATPTGDTIDSRLLPDEEEKDRVSTTSKVVSGVSPRKVKTMVVRPDGTLVEREVTEDDLKQQAANDAELMKIAQKAAQDAATANDSQGDDIAKAIENVPERLAPNDTTAEKPAEAVEAKAVKVEEVAPLQTEVAKVEPVQPVKIEDEQPAVAEKPADAAVTPVETTEAKPVETSVEEKPAEAATETTPVLTEEKPATLEEKPVETAVAEKPAERSIAVDTQQTVVDQDAVAKVAEAEVPDAQAEDAPVRKVKTTKITPVPEVRPVDQPVTVVGTVTDQGQQVRTEAKPQEVALADTTTQAAVPAGSYVIQIASLPSEAEAQTSYSRLSAKFAGIIGGKGVDIRKAQIKNKGTYYRVRIPAGSKQEAQSLCSEYKKAGGSCLVSK